MLFNCKGSLTSFGAPPVFSPGDLGSRLRLWLPKTVSYRYQDTAMTSPVGSSGQAIAAWKDASVNGNNALQASSGARAVEPAGFNGATFDGSNDFLSTPSLAAYGGDLFIGMVLTPTTLPGGFIRFLEKGATGSGVYIGTSSADNFVGFISGASSSAVAMTAGVKSYIGLERRGTTGYLYLNSATPVHTWTVSSSAISDGTTYIGCADGGGQYYNGTIHEVVIAASQTSGESGDLLTYLASV